MHFCILNVPKDRKMKNSLMIFALTFAVGSSALAQTPAPATKPAGDPVVATVDGFEVKKSQLDQAYEQNLLFVSPKRVTRESVLNDIISREIGLKKAKAENLQDDPIVKAKMEDVLYHAKISKDLEGKLKAINVTDKEAEDYYRNHKEIRTAHILFRMRAMPEKAEVDAAIKQALIVSDELKQKPQNWAELANKYSQTSNAASAGDMGYQPAINYAPEYYDHIKNKKVGYISPPVKTQFGFHLIKVLGIREWKDVDPALYKKIVYDQKRDKILEQYFSELRKSANVKINKEFLK